MESCQRERCRKTTLFTMRHAAAIQNQGKKCLTRNDMSHRGCSDGTCIAGGFLLSRTRQRWNSVGMRIREQMRTGKYDKCWSCPVPCRSPWMGKLQFAYGSVGASLRTCAPEASSRSLMTSLSIMLFLPSS